MCICDAWLCVIDGAVVSSHVIGFRLGGVTDFDAVLVRMSSSLSIYSSSQDDCAQL